MTWAKYEITGSKTAEIWMQIQDSFERIFIASGAPVGAAMYFSSTRPGKDVTLYLSPAGRELFSGSGWEFASCAKPASAGLLVGHDEDKIPNA